MNVGDSKVSAQYNPKEAGSSRKAGYTFLDKDNKPVEVSPDRFEHAERIDIDKDGILSEQEIRNFVPMMGRPGTPDEARLADDLKLYLQKKPLPQTKAFRSYEQMTNELKELAEKNKDKCEMTSLGKTEEGRDIWALKVGKKSTKEKPAALITGGTHAREWMGPEAALHGAKSMLEGYDKDPKMKNRVDNADTYFVPIVNPDGYEYSRTEDMLWRKNRSKNDDGIYGVDLNRNYYDGNPAHYNLYRPEGDSPNSTKDDKGGASDDPSSTGYRGREGGSEKESQALMNFVLKNKNINTSIDLHSYGEWVLYPAKNAKDTDQDVANYEKKAKDMAKIIKDSDSEHTEYRPVGLGSMETSGSGADMMHANGVESYGMEIGTSHIPLESEIKPTCEKINGALMYIVDNAIKNGPGMRA